MRFDNWLKSLFKRTSRSRKKTRQRRDVACGIDLLEQRTLLTTFQVTNGNDAGAGSLRDAVQQANANAGADDIEFSNDLFNSTITLTSGELPVTEDLLISAFGGSTPNLNISGNNSSRIFNVSNGATLELTRSLRLINGNAADGGAILNAGTVRTSQDVFFENNAATQNGGAIYSTGVLDIRETTIGSNTATSNGAGIYVAAAGQLTLNDSTVTGNTATADGGGIYSASSASSSINNTTISGNSAANGGGIKAESMLQVSSSLVSANNATNGAGIHSSASATLDVRNSTITGNTATGSGGGIYSLGGLTITNATIAHNNASIGNGGGVYDGASFTIDNTIVSNNTGGDFVNGMAAVGSERNLIDDTTAGANADRIGAVTGLSPTLADNGGRTQTLALSSTSNAIDAGSNSAANGLFLSSDQRGFPFARLIDITGVGAADTVDVGAFEFGPSISFDSPSVQEGDSGTSNLTFTITRSDDTTDVSIDLSTFDGTATVADSDYVPLVNQNLTFTANSGVLSKTFDVVVNGDTTAEFNETVFINTGQFNLTGAGFQGSSPQGTILNDEVSFTVDTNTDVTDGADGLTTLREAIVASNAAGPGQVIAFAASLNDSTITLTQGELPITEDMTINGPGSGSLTVSGNNSSRIFNIDDNDFGQTKTVSISGLTVRDGQSTRGVAFRNYENLTLTDVVVSNNTSTSDGGAGVFHRNGTLTLTDVEISNNTGQGNGEGTALIVESPATLSNVTISNNTGGRSVGISNRSTLTIANSTISGNSTNSDNDIIINNSDNSSLTITNSTVSNNTTESRTIYNQGTLTIQNSTISGNTTTRGDGGALYNGGYIRDNNGNKIGDRPGTASIINSTISGNTANDNGGAIWNNTTGSLTILNSTIAGNSAAQQGGGIFTNDPVTINNSIITGTINGGDLAGPGMISGGNNLIDDGHATSLGAVTNIDTNLRPNGGPTLTHALLSGSNAIDAGDNNAASTLTTDQRGAGFARVNGGTVDIGAFESGNVVPQVVQISDATVTEGDSGTVNLNFPIFLSDDSSDVMLTFQTEDITATGGTDFVAIANGMQTISAGSGNNHTITVTVNGDTDVEPNETLRLRLLTASGAGSPTLFNTTATGTITNDDLFLAVVDDAGDVVNAGDGVTTLREAVAAANASNADSQITFDAGLNGSTIMLTGGELVPMVNLTVTGLGNQNLTIDAGDTSRIFNTTSNLIVTDITLTNGNAPDDMNDNTDDNGGAINASGDVALTNVVITSSSAAQHGGAVASSGALTISNSSFSGNSATQQGAAIYGQGSGLTLSNSTVDNNSAVLGAVFAQNSTPATITDSTISNNTGGGVVTVASATITGSTISGNTSAAGFLPFGGIAAVSTLNVSNSTISGNSSTASNGGISLLTNFIGPFTATFNNVTIIGNSSASGAGGIINPPDATVVLNNSILTNNTGGDFENATVTGTNNLIDDMSGGANAGRLGAVTNISATLANNGGPTLTHGLLSGSNAIDAGDNNAANNAGLTTDQRGAGFPRIVDGTVDIGAFEGVTGPAATLDFGDAPDTANGTAAGNYQTLSTDSGPSHVVVANLFMGANVDAEAEALQNATATGDDTGSDDENGIADPATALALIAGTDPSIDVQVTNNTGNAATLYGWIDYNGDGVFDNATERASVAVPNGSTNATVSLAFPTVPGTFAANTFARFRLSTDNAAANSTGAATDGEVEDYAATIASAQTDVSVSVAPASVFENSGNDLVFTFTRATVSAAPITVNFDITGTADTANSDYTQTGAATFSGTGSTGSVLIPANMASATVTVSPTGDATIEPDETVILTITAGANYTAVAPISATGTIADDDDIATTVTLNAGVLTINDDKGLDNGYQLTLDTTPDPDEFVLTDTTGTLIDVSGIPGATSDAINIVRIPITGVTSLSIVGAGGTDTTTIGSPLNLTGNLSIDSDSTILNTSSITTTGTQNYNGSLILNENTTLTGSTVTLGAVNSQATETNSLTVTGNAVFDGAVGGNDQLSSLSVTGTAAINGGSISTTGLQNFQDAVTLNSNTTITASQVSFDATVNSQSGETNSLNITGGVTFQAAVGTVDQLDSISVSGMANINAGTISTVNDQNYNGPVGLVSGSTMIGSTVSFGDSVNSAPGQFLPLTITGNAIFDGAVGGIDQLTTLSVSGTTSIDGGSVSTTGTQSFTGDVTLASNTTLTGNVTFGGMINSAATETNSLSIVGNSVFNGTVGVGDALSAISVSGMTTINASQITTTGAQDYSGLVVVGVNGGLSSSTVNFGSTVNSASGENNSLSITGNADFNGAVGGVDALSALSVSGSAKIDGGSVQTTGSQNFDGGLTIESNTTLTGSTVTVGGSTNSQNGENNSLTISGDAVINGSVGGADALSTLSVSGMTTIDASAVTTTGTQDYDGGVTIGQNTILTGSTVTFAGTVDSLMGEINSLSITGDAVLQSPVGGDNVLRSVSVSGNATINGGSVSTTDAQNFAGPVVIGQNATFDGSTVILGSTVNSANGETNSLSIAGDAVLDGAVGGVDLLSSLSVSGSATINGGSISTSGTQNFTGPVILNSNSTLTGSTVTFDSTVNSEAAETNSLIITGNAVINGAMGTGDQLSSLNISGSALLEGGAIETSGTQTFGGPVTLGTATTFTGSTIIVNNSLNSASGENNLASILGNAQLAGPVGGSDPLSGINISGSTSITGGSVVTTGTQTYQGTVTTTGNTSFNAGATGDISMPDATNNLGGTISIVNARNVQLDAMGSINLGSSTIQGDLDLQLAGNVDFGGATTVGGALNIDTNANGGTGGTITDSTGSVSVGGTTNLDAGDQDITLDNATNDFQAPVSIIGAGVSIDDANGITFDSVAATGNLNVDTAGGVDFSGPATIGGNLVVDTTANGGTGGTITDSTGNVSITGTSSLAAGDQDITLDNPTNDFGGAVAIPSANNASIDDNNGITFGDVTTTGDLEVDSRGTVTLGGTTNVGGTQDIEENISVATDISLVNGVLTIIDAEGNTDNDFTISLDTTPDPDEFVIVDNASAANTIGSNITGATGTGTNSVRIPITGVMSVVINTSGGTDVVSPTNDLGLAGNLSITTNTINLTGTQTTAGSQTYDGDVVLDDNTTIVGSLVSFSGTINSASGETNSLNIMGDASFGSTLGKIDALNTLTVSGSATLSDGITTVGDQTFNGPIWIPESIIIDTGAGDFIATNPANVVTGSITIAAANNVSLDSSGGVDFQGVEITGNLNVDAAGDVQFLKSSGKKSKGTVNVGGNLNVDTNANGGTGGNVTATVGVTVTGETTVDAGNGDVVLNSASNDFGGAINIVASDVELDDTNGIALGNVNVTGNANIDAAGNVDVQGAVNVGGDLDIDTNENGGTGGTISDSTGSVSVGGSSNLDSGDQNTDLDDSNNDFSGPVNVTGNNVTIDDANGITFGTVNATGNLDVDAAGNVDFGGAASVGGSLDVDTNANGGNGGAITDSNGSVNVNGPTNLDAGNSVITLDAPTNDFVGTVGVTANNASIDDANMIAFSSVMTSGILNVETGGGVDFTGPTNVGGDLTVNTDANGGTGGNITNTTGTLNVGGDSTLDPGDQMAPAANDPNNNFTNPPAVEVLANTSNEAPIVDLVGVTASLAEDTDTSAAIKVATIVVTDDGIGSNSLSLSGADATLFQINGSDLELIANASLDFETNPVLDVTVNVDDPTVGVTPDDTAVASIMITDVFEQPELTLSIAPNSISESGGVATGTLTRVNASIGSALTVTLMSNDTSEATVPMSVDIPLGQPSTTFTINAVDDMEADGVQVVTITASAGGFTNGTAMLNVNDNDVADTDITVDGNGNLVINDANGGDTNDDTTFSSDGVNLIITDPNGGLTAPTIPGTTGNGSNSLTIPLNQFTGNILINGQGGNDTFTFDFTQGDFGADFIVDGGNGSDELRIVEDGNGTTVSSGTYTPDGTNFGDGVHTLNLAAGGTRSIGFINFEPTEVIGVPSYTLTTAGAADVLTVSATTSSVPDPALIVTGTSGGVAIESLTISQVTTFTIDAATNDGAGAADSITISSGLDDGGDLATGLMNLVIDAGNSGDGDTLTVGAVVDVPGAVTFSNFETVDVDFDVEAGTSLTIDGVSNEIDLGLNVDLTAEDGTLDLNNGVNQINLSAADGINRLIARGAAGHAELAPIVSNGCQGEVRIDADQRVDTAGINVPARITILANQDGAGAEGLTQTGDIITTSEADGSTTAAIDITVNTLVGGTGSASIGMLTAGTTAGRINVNAIMGAIVDANAATNNLTSKTATLIGAGGVGSAADPIETNIDGLEGAGSAGFFVSNSGSLSIGGVDAGLTGASAATGPLTISTTGALIVEQGETVSSSGALSLSNTDSSGNGELILISAGSTVSSTAGSVTLSAGDDITVSASATLSAATTLTIDSDVADADAGTGTNISLLGTITSGGAVTLDGGSDDDNYTITYPAAGTLTGPTTIVDGGGTDSVTVNGSSAGESLFVTSNANDTVVGRGAANLETITLPASIETLNLNAQAGMDTVTAQPSTNTAINLDGGLPGTTPGDTLNFDPLGNTFSIINSRFVTDGGFEDVAFANFESVPIGSVSAGPTQRFDLNDTFFNGTAQVPTTTQAGFSSVTPDTVFTTGNFGWNVPVGAFQSTNNSGAAAALINDGHAFDLESGADTRVFRATIGNGFVLGTVTFGSAFNALPAFQIEDADTGVVLASGLSTAAGEFGHVSFVTEVTNGTLGLRFRSPNGPNRLISINAIDLRPANVNGMGINPATSFLADGTTVDSFTLSGAPANSLVTVSTTLGTITNADADANLSGLQLLTDGAGTATLTVRRPSGPGTAAVTFTTPTGEQTGQSSIVYDVLTTKRFDFNTPTSATFDPFDSSTNPDGYVGVLTSDSFTDARGYGWLGVQPNNFELSPTTGGARASLRDDGHRHSSTDTFRVTLDNGTYQVRVLAGDDGDHQSIDVSANGTPVVASQGLNFRTFFDAVFTTTVTNGLLDLTFSQSDDSFVIGDPHWVVNAIEIVPQSAIGVITRGADIGTVAADGMTLTTITATSSLSPGDLVTVSTTVGNIDTLTTPDVDPSLLGHQVAVGAGGAISFDIQSTFKSGIPSIEIRSLDGTHRTTIFDATYLRFVPATSRLFDFNEGTNAISSSPTTATRIPVYHSDQSPSTVGYGFKGNNLVAFNQPGDIGGVTTDDLYRDGLRPELQGDGRQRIASETFQFDVKPGQEFDIRIYLGSTFLNFDMVQITVEGISSPIMVPSTAAGSFTSVTALGARDTNNDHLIDLVFSDEGGDFTGYAINGLDVVLSSTGLAPAAP